MGKLFKLHSRGCELCGHSGGCGEGPIDDPAAAAQGWLGGWMGKSHRCWAPRQQLLEAHQTKKPVSSGATAHVMEVSVPMPYEESSPPSDKVISEIINTNMM